VEVELDAGALASVEGAELVLELDDATGALELGVDEADDEPMLELALPEDPDEEPEDFEPDPCEPPSGSVYC
jgi:hypothetical protein